MLKKLVATALLGACGLAQALSVSLVPSSSTVLLGSSFTVDIRISDVTDLFGWDIDIEFDPITKVIATGVTEGPFLGSGTTFVPGSIDNGTGTVKDMANALSGVGGVTGSGVLATISFDAIDVGFANFSLSRVLLVDSNVDSIVIDNQTDWFGGRVEIIRQPDPNPTPLPATLALCALGLALTRIAGRRRD